MLIETESDRKKYGLSLTSKGAAACLVIPKQSVLVRRTISTGTTSREYLYGGMFPSMCGGNASQAIPESGIELLLKG